MAITDASLGSAAVTVPHDWQLARCVVFPPVAPRIHFLFAFVTLLLTMLTGCERDEQTRKTDGPPHALSGAWFEEVASEVGLDFVHVRAQRPRLHFPEIMSGGVCLFDYDGDGFLDVYFVQGGDLQQDSGARPENKLFHNQRNGSFEDVTTQSQTGDSSYGMGCATGDYNGDGHVDLYVTNVGPNVMYRNNGDGTFTDVTAATRLGDPGWGTSAAFADYDNDGLLDLFVVNYIQWSPGRERQCLSEWDEADYCSPNAYVAPAVDSLYHNNGDGTFADVRESAGIHLAFGNGLGIAPGDFNADGRLDFYVANDGMPNQLWINGGNGTFSDDALLSGCALNGVGAAEAGMGVMAVDVDYDGDLDLFLSHLRDETNTLYVNNTGVFDDLTAAVGLAAPSLPNTGFGLAFADFDHDSDLDLFIVNGRVALGRAALDEEKPYAEPNQLFQQTERMRFVEVLPRGGTVGILNEASRAAAFGDIDNDGDVDIVIVNNNARAHVLRNVVGSQRQWIMFRVLLRDGADALGASVRLDAELTQWRQVQTAYSYCAANDPRVHFGLGQAHDVENVMVRWPDGSEESFGPFRSRSVWTLREGEGRRVIDPN